MGARGRPVTAADREEFRTRPRLSTACTRGNCVRSASAPWKSVINPPSHWSVASTALFAEDGALWVGNPRRILTVASDGRTSTTSGPPNVWTVFPVGGQPYTVELPLRFNPYHVRHDKVYGTDFTDDDGSLVRVFSVSR
jgi:hypothetical protein